MVESMLDLNRFDAGVQRTARESVDVASVIDEAAGLLGPRPRPPSRSQGSNRGGRYPDGRGSGPIKQLVLHLGGNAVKFTPRVGA
jgi:signal transduction histidine kinase